MRNQSFSFVHAADLHLGAPFASLSRISSNIRETLLEASLAAFDKLVNETILRKASFLLIAGDAFDSDSHGVRAWMRFRLGCEKLQSANIQVMIVKGNHDARTDYASMNLPENVFIFSENMVEKKEIVIGGEPVATIHGISFSRPDVSDNLSLLFPSVADKNNRILNIAILHASLGSYSEHARYSPCVLADLMGRGYDYWALGHIHQGNTWEEAGSIIAYSGNIQGRSFKPSEQGKKGAVFISVESGRIAKREFFETDSVRFLTIEEDIAFCADLGSLQLKLQNSVDKLISEHKNCALLLRLCLIGRGDLSLVLARPGVNKNLLEELNLHYQSSTTDSSIYWESIENCTTTELNFQEIMARGDFSSELIRSGEEGIANNSLMTGVLQELESEIKKRKIPAWLLSELSMDELSLIVKDGLISAVALMEDERSR